MKIKSVLTVVVLLALLPVQPALAEYSKWMKIKKIESWGKKLIKSGLVPIKIECKRGPGPAHWRNTLFRVKLASKAKIKITGWKIIAEKTYRSGWGESKGVRSVYYSRSIVPPGNSGISASCGIVYSTPGKPRFFKKRRRWN